MFLNFYCQMKLFCYFAFLTICLRKSVVFKQNNTRANTYVTPRDCNKARTNNGYSSLAKTIGYRCIRIRDLCAYPRITSQLSLTSAHRNWISSLDVQYRKPDYKSIGLRGLSCTNTQNEYYNGVNGIGWRKGKTILRRPYLARHTAKRYWKHVTC